MNDTKRKRDQIPSNSSSDTSILDPKRSKQHKSLTDSDSSFDLSAGELTLPLQLSVCASSTPVCKSVALIMKPAMTSPDQIDINSLEQMLDKLLVRRLKEQKVEILQELDAKVSAELNEMKGEIHDLKVENDELKKRVAELEATSVSKKDAKIHAVNNDQYARRSSTVVYGITLKDKQDPGDAVIETIKTHLKTTLQRSAVEICHPLGRDNKNKKRPLVVRFRFRDVKWDIMKNRKMLKGTGISFAEDLCSEMRGLYNEIRDFENVVSVLAWNGKIMAKNKSGDIHVIRYGSEWKHLFPERNDEPESHNTPDMNVDEP